MTATSSASGPATSSRMRAGYSLAGENRALLSPLIDESFILRERGSGTHRAEERLSS